MKFLLADPVALKLTKIIPQADEITLLVETAQSKAVCPDCQTASTRLHSLYERRLADLPLAGITVHLRLRTRKFFCPNEDCHQRIFCERLPAVVAPYGRRTVRLNEALTVIGFALGGNAGARVSRRLALGASADTLLRRVRSAATTPKPTVRVLGVDDWALRRRERYGTILVDLERRRTIDLLPDREGSTVENWLKANPGVEIVTRDRSAAYAEGIRKGAPSAVQVSDRWHLLTNLTDAVERALNSRQSHVREAASMVIKSQISLAPAVINAGATTMLSSRSGRESEQNREKRYARYLQVIKLRKQGIAMHIIARTLKMSRVTVRRYIEADGFPERAPARARNSQLEKYAPYLHQRFAAGCDNATQLWREIVAQGYNGKVRMVRRYLWRLRDRTKALGTKQQLEIQSTADNFKSPSIRRAAWWLIKEVGELTAEQRQFVDQLIGLSPDIEKIRDLAASFRRMTARREAEQFEKWLAKARQSAVTEFRNFAEGLKKDQCAVQEALCSPWSNGQVEGQINRLKMLKRQMYGRANLDLLRARVLHKD
jgi:transposase